MGQHGIKQVAGQFDSVPFHQQEVVFEVLTNPGQLRIRKQA